MEDYLLGLKLGFVAYFLVRFVGFVCFCIGIYVGDKDARRTLEKQAIDRGLGKLIIDSSNSVQFVWNKISTIPNAEADK